MHDTVTGRGRVKGSSVERSVYATRAMEAAFFDLDKTVIATSSVMALGGRFYREGLISKRTIVRGIYAQVVYLLVGADDEKMERMREAMLALTKGWDQQHVERARARDARRRAHADHLRRSARAHRGAQARPGARP